MPFAVKNVTSQRAALRQLAEVAKRGALEPSIRSAAFALTSDCDARDDECEVQSIFDAVKTGDARVKGLGRGVRYTSDPKFIDYFTGPARLLEMCANGSCAGDCDDHAALVAALLAIIGYTVGLRAYARPGGGDYEHVYAVVGLPKNTPTRVVGLDTTVPESFVGWEPPPGRVMTAWIGAQAVDSAAPAVAGLRGYRR